MKANDTQIAFIDDIIEIFNLWRINPDIYDIKLSKSIPDDAACIVKRHGKKDIPYHSSELAKALHIMLEICRYTLNKSEVKPKKK